MHEKYLHRSKKKLAKIPQHWKYFPSISERVGSSRYTKKKLPTDCKHLFSSSPLVDSTRLVIMWFEMLLTRWRRLCWILQTFNYANNVLRFIFSFAADMSSSSPSKSLMYSYLTICWITFYICTICTILFYSLRVGISWLYYLKEVVKI